MVNMWQFTAAARNIAVRDISLKEEHLDSFMLFVWFAVHSGYIHEREYRILQITDQRPR